VGYLRHVRMHLNLQMVFQIAPEERHVNRKIQIAIMNPRGVTCFNVRID